MRTTVHLLRHGEVHNPTGVLYGRLPGFRLSEAGERMAVRAAEFLRGRDVAGLVTSPLERARQTVAPLEAEFGLTAEVDHRVIESTNVFEGRTVEFGAGAFTKPDLWRHLYNPFTPSWGEPYADVAERMLDAVADLRKQVEGREGVIVSHQLPVWTTRRAVEGRPLWHRPDRRQCALASITSLVYEGERLSHVVYAEPSGPGASKQGNVGA